MKLKKIELGKHIKPYLERTNIPNLKNEDISGVNKEKEFFEPSNQVGEDTSKYKIVPPKHFACNLMHVGRDVVLPIAFNHSDKRKIVSPAYFVFEIVDNDEILDEYFFLYLKSNERDRYFWFNTDGSIRDGMTWEDFVNVEIELPPIDIQKKYVNVYKAILENQRSYEGGLAELKISYTAALEKIRSETESRSIYPYIKERFEKNSDGKITFMKGVGLNGFIEPNQSRDDLSIKKCMIFYLNDFVYAPSSLKNGVISLNKYYEKAICTEEYVTFYVSNTEKLIPDYLLIWLKREELGRFIDFYVMDSVRNRFYFENLDVIEIPIPNIETQKKVVEIYKAFVDRKEINEQLKALVKNLCPVLIKGSIEEAGEGLYA